MIRDTAQIDNMEITLNMEKGLYIYHVPNGLIFQEAIYLSKTWNVQMDYLNGNMPVSQ